MFILWDSLTAIYHSASEHCCGHPQLSVHNIRLPKQSTVGDVINELKGKVRLILPLTCRYNLFILALHYTVPTSV